MNSFEFDLPGLDEGHGLNRLHDGYQRLAISVGIAIMAAFMLAGALHLLLQGRAWSSSEAVRVFLAFSVFLGFVAYSTGMAFPLYLQSAKQILMDGSGIRLTYWDSRVEIWRWDDPTLRFDLFDYSRQPDWTSPSAVFWIERPPLIPIITPYHRRNYLTREAVEALLAAVRTHGLSVKVSGTGHPRIPGTPAIYRIASRRAS